MSQSSRLFVVSVMSVAAIAMVSGCSKKHPAQSVADFTVQQLNATTEAQTAHVTFSVAKSNTLRGSGWVVFTETAPGTPPVTASVAIDLSGVSTSMGPEALLAYASAHAEVVAPVNQPDGRFTGNYTGGSGYTYSLAQGTQKDLELAGAVAQALELQAKGDAIAAKFSLSADRGLEIAKLVNDWTSISKSRAMTKADADALGLQAIGTTISSAQAAFEKAQNGDSSAMNAIVNKAAEINGTTPENISQILGGALNN